MAAYHGPSKRHHELNHRMALAFACRDAPFFFSEVDSAVFGDERAASELAGNTPLQVCVRGR